MFSKAEKSCYCVLSPLLVLLTYPLSTRDPFRTSSQIHTSSGAVIPKAVEELVRLMLPIVKHPPSLTFSRWLRVLRKKHSVSSWLCSLSLRWAGWGQTHRRQSRTLLTSFSSFQFFLDNPTILLLFLVFLNARKVLANPVQSGSSPQVGSSYCWDTPLFLFFSYTLSVLKDWHFLLGTSLVAPDSHILRS